MKIVEKLMQIIAAISAVFLMLVVLAIIVLSFIGLIKMAEHLVLPWFGGTLI